MKYYLYIKNSNMKDLSKLIHGYVMTKDEIERKITFLKQEVKRYESYIIDAKEWFKNDNYSKWDKNGIPTYDKNKIPLSKNARKRVEKAFAKQQKLYETFMENYEGQPDIINEIYQKIKSLENELNHLSL